jgi:hypothetical protein
MGDLRLPLTDRNVGGLPPTPGAQYRARDTKLAGFLASHLRRKNRSEKTIAHYADHVERLMAGWLDTPLSDLGDEPGLVADRHTAITEENGPAMANGAMRSLRAIYNHARKTCRKLPAENPTFAVDWNPENRRDMGLGARDLPAWFEQLAAIPNPVRREFHLLSILSGCNDLR